MKKLICRVVKLFAPGCFVSRWCWWWAHGLSDARALFFPSLLPSFLPIVRENCEDWIGAIRKEVCVYLVCLTHSFGSLCLSSGRVLFYNSVSYGKLMEIVPGGWVPFFFFSFWATPEAYGRSNQSRNCNSAQILKPMCHSGNSTYLLFLIICYFVPLHLQIFWGRAANCHWSFASGYEWALESKFGAEVKICNQHRSRRCVVAQQ